MPKTDIVVELGDLSGPDGNAFVIMGKVTKALKRGGAGDLVKEYTKEAMSGDYDHLLRTTAEYVEVE